MHRNCFIDNPLDYLPPKSQDLLRLRNNNSLMGYVNRNKANSVRYAAEIRRAEEQIETILKLPEENLQAR